MDLMKEYKTRLSRIMYCENVFFNRLLGLGQVKSGFVPQIRKKSHLKVNVKNS